MKLFKEISGTFVRPIKEYYIGRLRYGTPYFWPMNFNRQVIEIRKLLLKEESYCGNEIKNQSLLKDSHRFTNMPTVRRNNNWIFKILNNWYYIQIGWPIYIYWNSLGWKDKFDTPRYEWPPAFYIFFLNWQFYVWWNSPDGNNDQYYEQILWWKNYCNKNIKLAEETWGWSDYYTKESTWNKKYVL